MRWLISILLLILVIGYSRSVTAADHKANFCGQIDGIDYYVYFLRNINDYTCLKIEDCAGIAAGSECTIDSSS